MLYHIGALYSYECIFYLNWFRYSNLYSTTQTLPSMVHIQFKKNIFESICSLQKKAFKLFFVNNESEYANLQATFNGKRLENVGNFASTTDMTFCKLRNRFQFSNSWCPSEKAKGLTYSNKIHKSKEIHKKCNNMTHSLDFFGFVKIK